MKLPNPQLYNMTPKQQIIVFSRHVCKTIRVAKNAHDHRPLISMAKRDVATLWNTAIRLNQPEAETARRCAVAIERMMQ